MNIYVALNKSVDNYPYDPTIYIHCEDSDMAFEIAKYVFATDKVKILSYSIEPVGGWIYEVLKHRKRGYVDTSTYDYSDFIGTATMLNCPFVEYATRQEKLDKLF